MARITVDDCLKLIENRFELTIAAALRARQIDNGAHTFVERGRHKPPVIALYEFAAGHVGLEILTQYKAQ